MLYKKWIEDLTKGNFAWLNFIKPLFNSLIKMCDDIYSYSFNFFGAVFEIKYLSTLLIFVAISYIFKLISQVVEMIETGYLKTRKVYKKTEETLINKKLQADTTLEQVQITKYTIVVSTQIKRKFSHREIHVDIEEQNKLLNDFLTQKTGKAPVLYNGGFMYQFNNFDRIDNVLDTIFKVMKSNSMIDYAFCVQVGDNPKQLDKLISLYHFGKVTMAADTAYRYKFNASHRYQTSQVGIFQYDNGTIEAHEFKEIL